MSISFVPDNYPLLISSETHDVVILFFNNQRVSVLQSNHRICSFTISLMFLATLSKRGTNQLSKQFVWSASFHEETVGRSVCREEVE